MLRTYKELQTVIVQIKSNKRSNMIWIQTVYKFYLQLVSKEFAFV